jgi:UDP-N-acetylmuramoylalanine--D-glutamate ligase
MKPYGQAIVLGAGISGLGAARLLRAEGSAVTVLDAQPVDLWPLRPSFEKLGAKLLGAPDSFPGEAFDVVVVSPGIPDSSSWVQKARSSCHAVISELELGWSRRNARVIAVTGSNGKSTAVKWLTESIQRAGLTAVAAGNYGYSACEAALTHHTTDWWVLEVSSFQLETVKDFRPDIGVLLNILPNHLDRHGDMERYAIIKSRLFSRTAPSDICLTPSSWQERMQAWSAGQGQWISFGSDSSATYQVRASQVWQQDRCCLDARQTVFAAPAMGNTLGAVGAALDLILHGGDAARAAALDFVSLRHRVEPVAEYKGVRYVNDSKSTNLAATRHAIECLEAPVNLIAGGLAKAEDLKTIKEVLAQNVRSVYLIGESAEKMKAAWSCVVPCYLCGNLDQAVREASNNALPGEVVLLSPGCASFDQFKNYEDRGEHFIRLVARLKGREQE